MLLDPENHSPVRATTPQDRRSSQTPSSVGPESLAPAPNSPSPIAPIGAPRKRCV